MKLVSFERFNSLHVIFFFFSFLLLFANQAIEEKEMSTKDSFESELVVFLFA